MHLDLFDFHNFREQYVARFFKRGSRFHVAHAEPGKIEDRQRPAKNEKRIPGEAQPLQQSVRAIREELKRSRIEISDADRVIELHDAQRK